MSNVLVTALKNQGHSIVAMLSAEYALRISRRSLGIVEELLSLGFVAGSMLVLRLMAGGASHHGMPVLPFVISGLGLFWMFRTTLFRTANFKNAKLNFRGQPRVTALDVLLSRAVVNVLLYTSIVFPIFLLLIWMGWSPPMERPGMVLLIFELAGLWGFGTGLCFGALFLVAPFMRMVVGGLMMTMMWISGVMFIWPEVPYMLRPIFQWNPLFHFMELLRDAYFSAYETALGSWSFVLWTIFITLALGLALERVSRRRAEAGVYRRESDQQTFDDGVLG